MRDESPQLTNSLLFEHKVIEYKKKYKSVIYLCIYLEENIGKILVVDSHRSNALCDNTEFGKILLLPRTFYGRD